MKNKSEKNDDKGNGSDDEIKLLEQFAEKLEKQNQVIKKLLEQNKTKKNK